MNALLQRMIELIRVEPVEHNVFLGAHYPESPHVFGGQVMAQALYAAGCTVAPERSIHSMHGYFLRPGDAGRPVVLEVEDARDGTSFSSRRVIAIQHGKAIFNLDCSWQIPEDGLEHGTPLPEVTPPEALPLERDQYAKLERRFPDVKRFAFRYEAIDSAQVEGILLADSGNHPPRKHTWVRTADPLPDEPLLHVCMLAYISDMDFMGTSMMPHGPVDRRRFQGASLDHAMWFHRPFRVDEWLLFSKDSPTAGHARGFVRGEFHDRSGRLVASAAQECLLRMHEEAKREDGQAAGQG